MHFPNSRAFGQPSKPRNPTPVAREGCMPRMLFSNSRARVKACTGSRPCLIKPFMLADRPRSPDLRGGLTQAGCSSISHHFTGLATKRAETMILPPRGLSCESSCHSDLTNVTTAQTPYSYKHKGPFFHSIVSLLVIILGFFF